MFPGVFPTMEDHTYYHTYCLAQKKARECECKYAKICFKHLTTIVKKGVFTG